MDDHVLVTRSSREELAHWGLSSPLVRAYERQGIKKLYPWQIECVGLPKVRVRDSGVFVLYEFL